MNLTAQHTALTRLTRTDPDPHVCHRADGLLLAHQFAEVGRTGGTRHTALVAGLSAEPNLMGRVWRYLKQNLACHRFWNDAEGLETTASSILYRLETHFHSDEPPSIQLVKWQSSWL